MTCHDRCDRCSAQAYTAWWHAHSKGLLLFCAHHTNAHELALVAGGWELTIDDRSALMRSVREPEPA